MSTLQQDTRQLTAHIDGDHEGRIEQDGWGITIRVDHAEDPEMIRELVRRWNAHNELVEALGACMAMMEWEKSNGPEQAAYDKGQAALKQATK